MAASPGTVEGAPPGQVRVYAHRTRIAVVLIVTLHVPVVVCAAISGEPSVAGWALLSGIAVFQNLMLGGRAIAYLTVGLLAALTPLAIVSGSVPVAGAALMAIMCFWVGTSAGWAATRTATPIR